MPPIGVLFGIGVVLILLIYISVYKISKLDDIYRNNYILSRNKWQHVKIDTEQNKVRFIDEKSEKEIQIRSEFIKVFIDPLNIERPPLNVDKLRLLYDENIVHKL